MPRSAGIVLAGGRSTRMGSPKAELDWHGSSLLARVCGIVARAVDGPVIIVRAPDQELPRLPHGVEVVADAAPGRGPLQALHAGLATVADRAAVAYVSSTDVPLLHPRFVERVLRPWSQHTDIDIVLPLIGGRPQLLSAAYGTDLVAAIAELLAAGDRALRRLPERSRVLTLDEQALLEDPALAALDPELDSVLNLNEPSDYRRARRRPAPQVEIELAWARTGCGPTRVHAWTLGGALAGGLAERGDSVAASVGGAPVDDEDFPLVSGDRIAFRARNPKD